MSRARAATATAQPATPQMDVQGWLDALAASGHIVRAKEAADAHAYVQQEQRLLLHFLRAELTEQRDKIDSLLARIDAALEVPGST